MKKSIAFIIMLIVIFVALTAIIINIKKLLDSAIANAKINNKMDEEKLYVAECFANQSSTLKRIHPRAQGREGISIIQRPKEFSSNLIYAIRVVFQIIPRGRIGYHIETQSITAIFINLFKRIYSITKTFAHLLSLCIKHKT